MKKLLLLTLFLISLSYSCEKELIDDSFVNKQEKEEYEIYFESSRELALWLNEELKGEEFRVEDFSSLFKRDDEPLCYSAVDLLSFLTQYGQSVPDVIPAVPNDYFQDGNCINAKWTAEAYERDPLDGTANSSSMLPVDILWELDSDSAISTGGSFVLPFYTYTSDSLINENCPGIFQPSCDGYHTLTITMIFEDGSVYQRTGTAGGFVNNTPSIIPNCLLSGADYNGSDLNIFDFDCFCPLVFTEYQFLLNSGLMWDLDNNGLVDSSDLLGFLVEYGC